MATETVVTLPDDTGNGGKQLRAHSRSVGGSNVLNYVHEIQDPVNDVQARVLTGDAAATDAGVVTHPAPSSNTIGAVTLNPGNDDIATTNELLFLILHKLDEISQKL
jgi:hypothetical protein